MCVRVRGPFCGRTVHEKGLVEFRHKLVEQYCPIEINDAKVCRIVPPIVDPSLSIQQCVCGSRCAKGPSSLDYLAGRVHLDYEQRKVRGHDSHYSACIASLFDLAQSVGFRTDMDCRLADQARYNERTDRETRTFFWRNVAGLPLTSNDRFGSCVTS